MKIRISYTVEVNDEFRKAFRKWIADVTDTPVIRGLATRAELREHFIRYGSLPEDDISEMEPGAEMWILE